jgi:tetratricopeptide (TPR) repeat protein
LILWWVAAAAPSGDSLPQPSVSLLVLANEFYQRGEYQLAASIYDRLSDQGICNGPFYFNQGNAHFMAGNLPEAILAYRRAERFIASDSDLQANLVDARSRVVDPPATPKSNWPVWLRESRPKQAWMSFLSYLLGWGLFVYWLWKRNVQSLATGLFFLAIAMGQGAYVFFLERYDTANPLAVVSTDSTLLRKGNGLSYPPQEINSAPVRLNRGVEARVLTRRDNGWVQIELANGLIGWVPRDRVLIDEPGVP